MTTTFISNSLDKALEIFDNLCSEKDFATLFQISARKYAIADDFVAVSELSITAKLTAEKNKFHQTITYLD